ncbi:hypothetical protein [Paratractidigestivibacter sp.]|nr:hypothetical protein [Paratractidigestivibacter sp.]
MADLCDIVVGARVRGLAGEDTVKAVTPHGGGVLEVFCTTDQGVFGRRI